jgi:hypothetical protein
MQENLLRFVLALAMSLMVVASLDALSGALPPRPEPGTQRADSSEVSNGNASDGAVLLLDVQFPSTWGWEKTHWQSLWTGVEWLNPSTGTWHDVEGWQGTLDGLTSGDDQTLVGQKVWWVLSSNLGTGPFRWVVYDGKGGRPLVISEAFNLPKRAGQTMTVDVSLPSNQ